MSKRIEIDGKFYRVRRGKLAQIPDEWVGQVPTEQTMRKRPSKLVGKLKRATKWRFHGKGAGGPLYIKYMDNKTFQKGLEINK